MGRDSEGFIETPHLAYKLNNGNSAVADQKTKMILVYSWIFKNIILRSKEKCGNIILGFCEKLCVLR